MARPANNAASKIAAIPSAKRLLRGKGEPVFKGPSAIIVSFDFHSPEVCQNPCSNTYCYHQSFFVLSPRKRKMRFFGTLVFCVLRLVPMKVPAASLINIRGGEPFVLFSPGNQVPGPAQILFRQR